jgi:hypothetical protein
LDEFPITAGAMNGGESPAAQGNKGMLDGGRGTA